MELDVLDTRSSSFDLLDRLFESSVLEIRKPSVSRVEVRLARNTDAKSLETVDVEVRKVIVLAVRNSRKGVVVLGVGLSHDAQSSGDIPDRFGERSSRVLTARDGDDTSLGRVKKTSACHS